MKRVNAYYYDRLFKEAFNSILMSNGTSFIQTNKGGKKLLVVLVYEQPYYNAYIHDKE